MSSSTAADLVRQAREAEPIGAACEACEDAMATPAHGLYHRSCLLCSMRMVARTPAAFKAIHSKDRTALASLCAEALPNVDAGAARRGVWAWWQHDHPDAPTV